MDFLRTYWEWIQPISSDGLFHYFMGFIAPGVLLTFGLGKLLMLISPALLFKYGVTTYKQEGQVSTGPKAQGWNAEEEIKTLPPKCIVKYSPDEILVVNDKLKPFERLMALHFNKTENGVRIDIITKRTIPGVLFFAFFFFAAYYALVRESLFMFPEADASIICIVLAMVLLGFIGYLANVFYRYDKGLCEHINKGFMEHGSISGEQDSIGERNK